MKTKSFIIIIIFSFIALRAQQINSLWFDTENGLPQNSVKDIVQDKYGFIWISTENGVVKFDGLSFFNTNSKLLKNTRFSDFTGSIEKDNILCNSAYDEDLISISKRQVYYHKQLKTKKSINYKNKVYFLLNKKGLGKIQTVHFYIKLNKDEYLFSRKKIFYRSASVSKELKLILDNNFEDNIFCDKSNLYIVSKNHKKIIKISNGKINYYELPIFFKNNNRIYWSQVNNQTFIVRDSEILKLNFENNLPVPEKIINYNFKDLDIASIYYDNKNELLFLGTIANGLNIVRKSNFSYVENNNKKENYFYANLPFGKDRVITPKGTVYTENKSYKLYNFNNPENYFIYQDIEKNIFVKNDNRIIKFFKKSNYSKSENFTFNSPIDYFAIIDKNSFVSLNTKNKFKNKLLIFLNNEFKHPTKLFFFNDIITTVKKKNENEWFVGTRNGLFIIKLNNKFPLKIDSHNNIREIIKSDDGNFWITTQGNGFFLYRKNKIISLPIDKDNYLSFSHNLIEDKNGYLWISTNNGLFKVLKEELLEYTLHKRSDVHYYRYTKENGFATNEFNGGCFPSANKLSDGHFVFPSMKGLVFFKPEEIKSYYPSSFYIKTVKFSENKSQQKKNNLILDHNFHKAEVYIDVPYYANSENLVLEAKIENSQSNKWERLISRKYLIMGLEPGNYKLTIRALASDKGDYIYKTLNISVKYLFYQTFLFRFLLVLFILIFVLLIIKVKIRKQQIKNIVLEKIIESRTEKLSETVKTLEITKERLRKETQQQKKLLETICHDVITPAKYFSITTKKLYETEEKDYYKLKKYFEALHKSSEEFYSFVKTLKEYAEIYRISNKDYEIFPLNEVIESKIMLFNEIAISNNTNIINNIKRRIEINSNKKVISIIIHNIIDNAVKNTSNGFIDIFVEIVKKGIVIIIRDSGSGMTIEQMKYYNEILKNNDEGKLILQKYGLGLHLIVQLLTIINGELNFSQNFPKGTIATITIKNRFNE